MCKKNLYCHKKIMYGLVFSHVCTHVLAPEINSNSDLIPIPKGWD